MQSTAHTKLTLCTLICSECILSKDAPTCMCVHVYTCALFLLLKLKRLSENCNLGIEAGVN